MAPRFLQFVTLLIAIPLWPAFATAEDQPIDAEAVEFFEKRVRPVLVARCYKCHSEEGKKKGGLLLDSKAGWMAGGDSGPAIVTGDADKSLFIEAIRYKNEFVQMPPKGKLPNHEIEALVKWIEMGAPDPRTGKTAQPEQQKIDIEEGRKFWSFQPIDNPQPPKTDGDDWSRNAIDRFIYAKLKENALVPAEDAPRQVLIRRAYLDLIGLPPTPEQIEAFVNDNSPDAFAKVVDELLASEHFGERWGRHWLDISRYAESSGGGRTLIFPNAWRFRDYVIKSFNDDKPYDQFVREQIAGDLLPYDSLQQRSDQLTGSGYLMLGAINYELQDKELLRMEIVDEQIHTMGRTFLGMTLGCARCHDHMFDPIPTEDYYALAGIFRSTHSVLPGNVGRFIETDLPLPPKQQALREELRPSIDSVKERLAQQKESLKQVQEQLARLTGKPGHKREPVAKNISASAALDGIVIDDAEASLHGEWTSSTSVSRYIDEGYRHALGGSDAKAVFTADLPGTGEYEVRLAYSENQNRAPRVPVEVQHSGGAADLVVNQQHRPKLAKHFVSLGTYTFKGKGKVTIDASKADGVVIIDAVQFLPKAAAADAKPEAKPEPHNIPEAIAKLESDVLSLKDAVKKLEDELKSLEKRLPKTQKVMSVNDHEQAGDYFVCIRGNAHKLGDKVRRGFVQVITPKGESARPDTITGGQSGRLQLADWLASRENPLTARVMANRIWLHLMGQGIVRTPDNFGVPGERPTHPRLLDHLASRFVADGWSVKQTVRHIMLSRAYQMSTKASPESARIDTDNRLFHHANAKRLDAEVIRDVMLSISGQLDTTPGGPGMRSGTRSELKYKFSSTRRSVYVPVFRNTVDPLLDVFDFPNPNVVTGKRNASTLPTQALYLMNSPFVHRQAEATAHRLLAMEGAEDADRLKWLYQHTLSRAPTDVEIKLTMDFLASSSRGDAEDGKKARTAAWSGVVQGLFASIDFRYLY